jgi:hypothetical protein
MEGSMVMKRDLYADMRVPSLLSRAANVPETGVPPSSVIWEAFKSDVALVNYLESLPELTVFLDLVGVWILTTRWSAYWRASDPRYAEVTEGMGDEGLERRMKRALAKRLRWDLKLKITWKEGSLQ